jgi:hypothetical protein
MDGVRRSLAVALAAFAAGCGGAEAPPPSPVGDEARTLGGYGLRVTASPRWDAEISRGAVRLANRALPPLGGGPRALEPGDLVVEVLERELPDDERAAVPVVSATPPITADAFAAPEDGTYPAHHGVLVRPFSVAGRVFVLFAEAGSRPVEDTTVEEANQILATLEVEPGDFYPGAVDPPSFAPAGGWHEGSSGPRPRGPDSEWATGWAATVPYRDEWNALPPRKTIEALPADAIVIWVGLSRFAALGLAEPDAGPPSFPYRLSDFVRHAEWEGQVGDVPEYELVRRVPGQYELNVRIYFGRGDPSAEMRDAAEAALERLRLPDWGPWELQ